MKSSSGYKEKSVWNGMLCEKICITVSVTINVESKILRRCGYGEWRVQETFFCATEELGEIVTARNKRNNFFLNILLTVHLNIFIY